MSAAWRKWQSAFWLAVVVAVLVWSASGMTTHSVAFSTALHATGVILRGMVVEADWAYTPTLIGKLIETVQMAFLGTLVAAFLAVPFGFLAAHNTGRRVSTVGKFLLDLVRVFPEVILAIIFIKGVGPGPMAGVLAMGIHSIGMLGKLYGEAVEAIDRGPLEALVSTGANRIQQIWYAIIPQVLPDFSSYAIYRFEINARAATLLGVVGAGGIGTPLIFAIYDRRWGRVGIILLGIVLVVTVIDFLSGWLRKRLV